MTKIFRLQINQKQPYPNLWETCWPSGVHSHGWSLDTPAPSLQTVLKRERNNHESPPNSWTSSPSLQLFTSQSLPVHLPLLDEPAKHLSLHEDLQEAAHSLGRDRFAKTLALEGAGDRGWGRGGVAIFPFSGDEELIVAYQLHEETNEGLAYNGAEMARVYRAEDKYCNMHTKIQPQGAVMPHQWLCLLLSHSQALFSSPEHSPGRIGA